MWAYKLLEGLNGVWYVVGGGGGGGGGAEGYAVGLDQCLKQYLPFT